MRTAVPSVSPPPVVAPVAEFARTPVRRIMRSGVVSVPGNASLLQAAKALAGHGMHAVLVLRSGSPEQVGWLTSSALIGRLLECSPFEPVADAVTEKVTCIAPSATIADAIRALATPGVTHLLVTNGTGGPQGVVSDTDIARFFAAYPYRPRLSPIRPSPMQGETGMRDPAPTGPGSGR